MLRRILGAAAVFFACLILFTPFEEVLFAVLFGEAVGLSFKASLTLGLFLALLGVIFLAPRGGSHE